MKRVRLLAYFIVTILVVLALIPLSQPVISGEKSGDSQSSKISAKKVSSKKKIKAKGNKRSNKNVPYDDPTDMQKLSGKYYFNSSETKTKYPNLNKYNRLWIRVSIYGNRTYVLSGNKVIYTMYSSAGKIVNGKSLTPAGTYHLQAEYGDVFYNSNGVGARYYISYYMHGTYLFHSVPINNFGSGSCYQGYYYGYKGGKHLTTLGKKPDSHGCVRLSVKDAEWLYTQRVKGYLPVGTKIVIKYY